MSLTFSPTDFRHEYKGESFSFKYEKKTLSIYIQADSKNKIFKIKFETSIPEIKSTLEQISKDLIDKNLDELLCGMAHDFKIENSIQDYCLLHFKEALYAYAGEKRDLNLIDGDHLICRCAKLDFNAIQNNFIKENGDKKEFYKKTNASMICGQCAIQVNILLDELGVKHKMFLGKSYSDWNELILAALTEFAFYSPEEFQGAKFQIKKLSLPLVELKISVPHQNLTESFAQKSLVNYLSRELEVGLDIKVVIDNFLSN